MGTFRRTTDDPVPTESGASDAGALDELVSAGAVLGRQRNVQHFLVCDARSGARTATLQLHEAGFDASMFENPTASGWIVVAERVEALDLETVGLSRSLLELIASRATNAQYDGWRTELLDDEIAAVPVED